MAKKDKKKKDKKLKKDKTLRNKARETGKALESGAIEASRKIWLAGIGAYGMAYDVARSGASTATEQSVEMFEDLVKRGGELETDVMARLSDNTVTKSASKGAKRVVDTSQKLQEKVRERFDARMARMRDLLGVNREGSTADKLARRLEQLEDEVAAATKGAMKKGDQMLKKRLARLSEEIDAYVGDAAEEAPVKKAKKTVKKAAKKTTAKAEKPVKAAAKAVKETAAIVADDLTQINGVGPAMAKRLGDEGVVSFQQLAVLNKAEAEALDAKIGGNGRLIRDGWVSQAKTLAKA
ncbi:MAG: phasin family protein [Pseudomonadota bacterium]